MKSQIQMSINFERNEVQVYIEGALGCGDVVNWPSYKQELERWTISESDVSQLNNCVNSDITSYFFKGYESFIQALIGIHRKRHTWAIVMLYYAVFYFLRCDILLSNHLIVRCKGLFKCELKENAKFKPYNAGKFKGDHQLTIAIVKELCRTGVLVDPILGNQIDGEDPYSWLLLNRERVNYQQKNFSEPNYDMCLSHLYPKYFENGSVLELIRFYNNSDYTVCFFTDHSILSIPYMKMIQILCKNSGRIDFSGKYLRKMIVHLKDLQELGIPQKQVFKMVSKHIGRHLA